jgi:GNAT superfamily N-acetyltransferase
VLRDGAADDADRLTDLFLRARATAMPWLAVVHTAAETRWWMEHVVLAGLRVRVADGGCGPLGFAAVEGSWLEHLYVDPAAQGRGIGRALLEDALGALSGPVSLHVFTRNERARRFYEAAGFVLTGDGDGSGNEEREPDCTYTRSVVS